MSDQVIDATMASAMQVDAARQHVQSAWIIQQDAREHPEKYVARFATDRPTICVLVADTLAEVQAMLPPGLQPSHRQPSDPPDVVEICSRVVRRRGVSRQA